jgi:hypothetical protein
LTSIITATNTAQLQKRWRDAPSICVGREVIGILPVELERKTHKKELDESPDEGG